MIKIKVKFIHRQDEIEYSTDLNSLLCLYCKDNEIEYIKNRDGDFIKKDDKIYKEKIK